MSFKDTNQWLSLLSQRSAPSGNGLRPCRIIWVAVPEKEQIKFSSEVIKRLPWIIPWIVAAHFVPGSENLSTNTLIARARELSRLVEVLKMPAMSIQRMSIFELTAFNFKWHFQTCPRQPGYGTPCYIQDTACPFRETHKAISWISFHCPRPVIDSSSVFSIF